jgi:D-sedoheptulose 7-phosphate isomerase
MPLHDRILGHFKATAQAMLDSADALAPAIDAAARLMVHTLAQGGKVMICGNGGAAANAQHFAALMINRFEQERPGLAAIALTTDTSTLTAIANDHAYEQVYARQVKALAHPGDILLTLSVNGDSPGLRAAVAAAHARGVHVIALAGGSGGALAEQLTANDVMLCVPAESTARIQEIHLLTLHCLCDAVDSVLLGVEE